MTIEELDEYKGNTVSLWKFSSTTCSIREYVLNYNESTNQWSYYDEIAKFTVTLSYQRDFEDFSSTYEEAELKDYMYNIQKNTERITDFKKRISQQESDIQRLEKANEYFHEKYSYLREKYPEKFI